MSLHPSTMPGVLIDDSDDSAGPDTRALFYAAETPTQAEVIRTAQWLGVNPLQHAFNLDLNFHELEPGDLAALGYITPQATEPKVEQPTAEQYTRRPLGEAALLVLIYCASMVIVSVSVVYIWSRWFS